MAEMRRSVSLVKRKKRTFRRMIPPKQAGGRTDIVTQTGVRHVYNRSLQRSTTEVLLLLKRFPAALSIHQNTGMYLLYVLHEAMHPLALSHARSKNVWHTQLAKMSFDKIIDLTADVLFC